MCRDRFDAGVLHRGCGHEWETDSEQPDACPRCGAWKTVEIGRCYECPLSALEEEMETARGMLIARCFSIQNLMNARVQFGPGDLTAEEARVIEWIAVEKPVSHSLVPDAS